MFVFAIIFEAEYPQIVNSLSSVGFTFLKEKYPEFITDNDRPYIQVYIDWFGILYSVLFSLALIRSIEGFDKIQQELLLEAGNVKILHKAIMLLDEKKYFYSKQRMLCKLHIYCRHIIMRCDIENLRENSFFKRHGDSILQSIFTDYNSLISLAGEKKTPQLEIITSELQRCIHNVIDRRENRLAFIEQISFTDLRYLVVLPTVLGLLPLYFTNPNGGIFTEFLLLGAVFLVTFILTMIDDFASPFTGFWKVNMKPWYEIYRDTEISFYRITNKVYKEEKIKQNNITLISRLLALGGLLMIFLLSLIKKRYNKHRNC
jgi:hypothetical protein